MTRRILFQIHWFLGMVIGLVLVVMAISGAAISFAPELLFSLNRDITTTPLQDRPRLSLDELVARVQAKVPDRKVEQISQFADPIRNPLFALTYRPNNARLNLDYRQFVNPYTGELLGRERGYDTYIWLQLLHTSLLIPDGSVGWGLYVADIASFALIYFGLSGLYLHWPRQPLNWRAWLVLDTRKSGRNFHRALHGTLGVWVVLFYIVCAVTGLFLGVFRSEFHTVLVGEGARHDVGRFHPVEGIPYPYGSRVHAGDRPGDPSLAVALDRFGRETGYQPHKRINITLPSGGGAAVTVFGIPVGARHDLQGDLLTVDGTSGRVITPLDRYETRALGIRVFEGAYEIHRGAYFGVIGRIIMFAATAALPVFAVTGLLLYLARRRKKRELAATLH